MVAGRQRCGWTRDGSSSSVLFQFLVDRWFAVMSLYACRDPGRERAFPLPFLAWQVRPTMQYLRRCVTIAHKCGDYHPAEDRTTGRSWRRRVCTMRRSSRSPPSSPTTPPASGRCSGQMLPGSSNTFLLVRSKQCRDLEFWRTRSGEKVSTGQTTSANAS